MTSLNICYIINTILKHSLYIKYLEGVMELLEMERLIKLFMELGINS